MEWNHSMGSSFGLRQPPILPSGNSLKDCIVSSELQRNGSQLTGQEDRHRGQTYVDLDQRIKNTPGFVNRRQRRGRGKESKGWFCRSITASPRVHNIIVRMARKVVKEWKNDRSINA
uniref:Uncharacterized protein n=1 Tax=Ditylenchus dipsaci TaxID=166011 RepID=A0A915CY23_9BILA